MNAGRAETEVEYDIGFDDTGRIHALEIQVLFDEQPLTLPLRSRCCSVGRPSACPEMALPAMSLFFRCPLNAVLSRGGSPGTVIFLDAHESFNLSRDGAGLTATFSYMPTKPSPCREMALPALS